PGVDRAGCAVGSRLRRPRDPHRAVHAQRPGDERELPDLLPAAVPDAELRALRPPDAADGGAGPSEPGELRDRGTALAGATGLGAGEAGDLPGRDRGNGAGAD